MRFSRLFALAAVLALVGCATANYSSGTAFDTSKVPLIQKEVTTKQQITAWFGQPYTKSVSGTSGEVWVYMHSQGTSKAKSLIFTVDVQMTGTLTKLDILFKDDVVQNFTFTDGAMPGTTVKSSLGN